MILAYEATHDLPLEEIRVVTPDGATNTKVIAGKKAIVVALLRAGLVLAEGALEVMPAAHVGHIGVRLEKDTHLASEYLVALPDLENRLFILMDAVIGTGNTACCAIDILKKLGVAGENIRYCTILAAPQGLEKLRDKHPDVSLYVISVEEGLRDKYHIVPGFGDASDRLFGFSRRSK